MAFTFLTPMGQFSASMLRDLSAAFREGDRCRITQQVFPHSLCFQNLHFPAFFPLHWSLLSDLGCYLLLSPIMYCGGSRTPFLPHPYLPSLPWCSHIISQLQTPSVQRLPCSRHHRSSLSPRLPEPTSHGSVTDFGDTSTLTCSSCRHPNLLYPNFLISLVPR